MSLRAFSIVSCFLAVCGFLTAPAIGQNDAIPIPENLVADGVPPIPAAIADQVRRYTEARGASLADWHPTRRELLISTRFANTNQLHFVKQPVGARTQLTFFNEPVGGGSFDPASGEFFLFARDTGGNEFSQLYRYDLGDGMVTILSDGGRSQNGGLVWSNSKDRIGYASTRRNGADRDFWTMNPADPGTDRLLVENSGGGWGIADWSPDDSQLVVVEYISVNKSNLYLVDFVSGQKTPLTDRDATVSYGGAEFTADGKGLYLTSDEEGEFQNLVLMNLADRTTTNLTGGIPWDIDNFDLSDDAKRIALTVNEAGSSKLYLMNTSDHRATPVEGLPAGQVSGLEWHSNSRDLGFSINSARSTSDIYSLDVDSGEVTRWTESELGGLVASELSEPELIGWKSFDGLEISGFLYRPPATFTGPRPVIINIHGGPEGQARTGFLGRNNYFLNDMGVAIIYPNVRGSSGFGKTFVTLDNSMKREDSVRDIGALLDWIAEQPDLDADRVMVTGGSYGGYMTLAVATNYNDRIRCALDVVGISNFATFLKNTEDYRRDLRRVEYGDERDPEIAEFFEKIAPLNNAGKITKPLFVVQGANDPRVPMSEAEQMVSIVKSNGTPVWYLMARDEGHGFRKKANADFQFYATIMFVKAFLLEE